MSFMYMIKLHRPFLSFIYLFVYI